MIKFKEKLFFAPVVAGAAAAAPAAASAGSGLLAAMGGKLGLGVMAGTTGLSMTQAHFQGKASEEQAEESQRLQKRMNKQLARIADSGDPAKGQQAAAVLQGQAFSDVSSDIGEDLGEGMKKAGNAVGGATGTLVGGATGSVLGAGTGMAGAGLWNKFVAGKPAATAAKGATTAVTKGAAAGIGRVGIGKAGLIGMAAGTIGGSILGGQKGSSLFSQKSFAVGSELLKAGKGLLKVAGQHKGTVAEGLAAGAVMGGAGYAANKAIKSDEENGTSSGLKKIALGAGTALLGAAALKRGANWGAFGKYGNVAKRAGSALQTGTVFGAGMAAAPELIKRSQAKQMQEDTGGEQKKQGMGTATKVLLGAGLALGAAKGGHMLAKSGKLGFTGGQRDAAKKVAENISNKISTFKDTTIRKVGGDKFGNKLADGRLKYNEAQKMAKNTTPKYSEAKFKEAPGEYLLNKVTGFIGGGTQRTQRLADQLKATDSKILQDTGKFMNKYKKTALVGAAVPGYMATMGSWTKGEDLTTSALKKIDPKAFEKDNDNI